jgi:hypothetical protein
VGHVETKSLTAVLATKSSGDPEITKRKEGLQFNSSGSVYRPDATAETGRLIMAARAPRHRHPVGRDSLKTLSNSNDTL